MDSEEGIKIYKITEEIKGYQKEIAKLKQENKQLKDKLEFEERIARDYEKQKDKMYMNWLMACEDRNKLKEKIANIEEVVSKPWYISDVELAGYIKRIIDGDDSSFDNPILGVPTFLDKMQELEKSDKCEYR